MLLPAAVISLSFSFTARAQVYFGVKGGLNLTNLDGSINRKAEYRPAFHGGVFLTGFVGRTVAFQPEILYSAQGNKFGLSSTASPENTLRMSTVQVPLLVKLYPNKHFYLAAGPQLSVLVNAEEEIIRSGNSAVVTDVKNRYKTGDFGLVGGLGVEVSRLTFDARLVYGLTDLNNDPDEAAFRARAGFGGLHHRVFQLSAGFRILN